MNTPIFDSLMAEYKNAGRPIKLVNRKSRDLFDWVTFQRIGMQVIDPADFIVIKNVT